jgi:uncharacterized RDD family membrane protein YckC
MKNIEVKTTQNVVLEYELADLRDRIVAFLVDLMVMGAIIGLLAFVGYGGFFLEGTAGMVYGIFLSTIFVFYSLALETLNHGQSVGKMLMKIKVMKINGSRASFSDYAARWVFRMIDIYFSFGGIASILVASSDKAQRIGDIVATTAVVKTLPKMDLKLQDILNLKSRDSHAITYLQAKYLKEHEALLIKSTLDRFKSFPNNAHREAVVMLAEKLQKNFKTELEQKNAKQFLQTVLHDYVVLTR